jgi:MOSC domain-containing protein YiiM
MSADDDVSPTPHKQARVLSVNVATARRIQVGDRVMLSAIHKRPVQGDVAVHPLGLEGDEQADLSVHGGLSKAVYAYPGEHYAFWRRMRALEQVSLFDEIYDEPLPWGALGENLTLAGLLEHELWLGDCLVFARCTLRVSEPRYPCGKFTAALAMPGAAKLMVREANCGVYLAVDQPGHIQTGETFQLVPGPRRQSLVGLFKARMTGRKV